MTKASESTASSRDRLLQAGKHLFAQNGYEATSTASIAREAQTSESQLVRYFSSKAGLLEEIFNESWEMLNPTLQERVLASATAREAILKVLDLLMEAFREDPDLATIFLFEGRRIRGASHEIFISEGFLRFRNLLGKLIERGRAEGSFREDLDMGGMVGALIGAAEGMMRERLISQRLDEPPPFSREQVAGIMGAVLDGLHSTPGSTRSPSA